MTGRPEAPASAAPSDGAAERLALQQAFVERHLRRNFVAHYVHGVLGLTGFRVMYAPTFMPAYLHVLTGSAAWVGAGQALLQLGMVLSPIVGATRIEHRARILPVAARLGSLMRLQILALALVGWFAGGVVGVVLTFALLFLLGLFMGAQRVAFQMLMAKVIPLRVRGRLQAWRNLSGGAVAALLAWLSGVWLIDRDPFGNGYATTFFLVFVITSVGLWVLQRRLAEPEAVVRRAHASLLGRLREAPALLADRNYRHFLIAQALAVGGRIAAPFYVLQAQRSVELDGAMLGLLSLAYLGADTLANLAWGYLGDARGFRRGFLLSLTLWVAAMGLLLLAEGRVGILLAFCGLGAAISGYTISVASMVLEFGRREDLPMRLALSATGEALVSTVAPLCGGVIVALFGPAAALGVAMVLVSAAWLVLRAFVVEPRAAPES